MAKKKSVASMAEQLVVVGGAPISLPAHDPRSTPGFSGSKSDAAAALQELGPRLADLQERHYADGRTGTSSSVLLVLQGMDTSGKGGTVRHVVGQCDPQGVHVKAFKAPTAEEKRHEFLWRVKNELPSPGCIGVFDRSHYEDVLIARVRKLTTPATITRRYATINRWEQSLVDQGTVVIKVMLHISADEQKERLLARLDDPTKHWKYNPADVDERALWDDYQRAYELALEHTSTEVAPWHVVPADRKWYRNYAVTRLLVEALESRDPQWPKADYDVATERLRVEAS